MKEVFGDLWSYKRKGFIICITTNGFIKNDGTGVMGAGCAKEAMKEDPTLPALLGKSLMTRGNILSRLTQDIISFPVKHVWYKDADPELIVRSASALKKLAEETPDTTFLLPRPGCGNGGLNWADVKPMLELLELPSNVWIVSHWEDRPK